VEPTDFHRWFLPFSLFAGAGGSFVSLSFTMKRNYTFLSFNCTHRALRREVEEGAIRKILEYLNLWRMLPQKVDMSRLEFSGIITATLKKGALHTIIKFP
jgi:hypothetical protein